MYCPCILYMIKKEEKIHDILGALLDWVQYNISISNLKDMLNRRFIKSVLSGLHKKINLNK